VRVEDRGVIGRSGLVQRLHESANPRSHHEQIADPISPKVVNTVAVPSLIITKSHSGSLIHGQATTFTLSVSNAGNAPTDGSPVTISEPFPADSFSSIANAGGPAGIARSTASR
jgi:hypothetical protein